MIFVELEKIEIDYLKRFLKILDDNGICSLTSACENKEFAISPLKDIISKIIEINDSSMDQELHSLFKELENIDGEITKIRSDIRSEMTSIFDDPEESTDPEVIKMLNLQSLKYDVYGAKVDEAVRLVGFKPQAVAIKSNYFIKMFPSIQERLDFINRELDKHIILPGCRELFTSLGYESTVESYSQFNLYYVKYKFPNVFGLDLKLIYDKTIYEVPEERIINPGFEGEEIYN